MSLFGGGSNGPEVMARLRSKVNALAADSTLARDMAEVVGGGIYNRAMREEAPDGSYWTANAESTIRRKGGLDAVGIGLTQEMLARENFTSATTVTPDGITVAYSGDAQKVRWFEGDNNYGISRQLWGLDPTIRSEILALLQLHFKSKLH